MGGGSCIHAAIDGVGVVFGLSLGRSRHKPIRAGGLDEALGLAVGERSVGPGETVHDVVLAQCLSKRDAAVASAVAGEHALDREAEACEVLTRHLEEASGRAVGLIGQDGRQADARVVVDGHVQILPTGGARPHLPSSGHAVARLPDASQALDVEVDHVAGALVFVAHHGGAADRAKAGG